MSIDHRENQSMLPMSVLSANDPLTLPNVYQQPQQPREVSLNASEPAGEGSSGNLSISGTNNQSGSVLLGNLAAAPGSNNGSQYNIHQSVNGQQVVFLNPQQMMHPGQGGQQAPQQHTMFQPFSNNVGIVQHQQQQQHGYHQHINTGLLPPPSHAQAQQHMILPGHHQQQHQFQPQGVQQGSPKAKGANHVPPALHVYEQQQLAGKSGDASTRQQLICNYLAPNVTSEELFSIFKQFENLESARVIYDHQTKASKGYGFLYFSHPDNARHALESMTGHRLHGKHLRLSYTTNPFKGK